jgi:Xaa-Pro aminopeptidase
MDPIAKLQTAMEEAGLATLLISDIGGVQWLTGFTGSFGYVLVTLTKSIFITDSRYTIQAQEQVPSLELRSFASPLRFVDLLGTIASELKLESLGFEATSVNYSTFDDWQRALPEVSLVPAPDLIGQLRMIKSAEEVNKIRSACALTDAAWTHIQRMVQPGVTEYDLQLDLEFYMRRQGAALAFEPIVVSGAKSARPHGKASDKKLEKGDFLTCDFGAKVDGYCADLTRTVVVGEASDRHRELYDLVLKAQLECIAAMRPGVAAKDVDALARFIFGDQAKYFGHGLGHGLGRLVHDTGRMNATSTDILAVGQVWTVEPGLYIEGFGGVRIEDDVVVTETGVEILNHSPKHLTILPS